MLIIPLISLLLIHLIYWVFLFTRIAVFSIKADVKGTEYPGVSVLVSVKNEEENLPELISFLKSQDYPKFEIIIIDDFSTDRTGEILSKEGIKTIRPSQDILGKKLALTEGINQASYPYILTTDGDCLGKSDQWVKSMVIANQDKGVTLGFAPLLDHSNLASLFASYEAFITAIQYLSYGIAGIPYMGVGRNLLFKKDLFVKNNGYQNHMDISSGDDDLLVNEIANADNTTVCLSPNSFMYSKAPETLKQFLRQKSRHLSTSTKYRLFHILLLSGFSMSHILFYVLGIIAIIMGEWKLVGTLWAIKVIVQGIISIFLVSKLKQGHLVRWGMIFDVFLFIYYVGMSPYIFFKNKTHWN